MTEERLIDLLTGAANRGTPRGANEVWDAAANAAPRRASVRGRRMRVVVAVGFVLVMLVGALSLAASDQSTRGVSGIRFASPVSLPPGWHENEVILARGAGTTEQEIMAVYRRDDDVIVTQGFARLDLGLVWVVPAGELVAERIVGDAVARYAVGTHVDELDAITLDRPDSRARVLGRGVSEEEMFAAADDLVAGRSTVPEGFELAYAGPEATGVWGVGGNGITTVEVTAPSGAGVFVQSAQAPFAIAAIDWFFPVVSTVDVNGRDVTIVRSDPGTIVVLELDGLSVTIGGSDASEAEKLAIARSLEVAAEATDDAGDRGDR